MGPRLSVAYVVLAHRLPDQVARLVRRLLPGGHSVVVHVDAKVDQVPFERALAGFLDAGRVSFVADRVVCRWADYSLVEATLRGTEAALAAAPCASHVVLLSGQSYPIKPPDAITAFFAEHEDRSFLFASAGDGDEAVDRTGNERWSWDGELDRLGRVHFRIGGRLVSLPNRYVPWWPYRQMPHGMRPLQGSQWWALSAAAARHVLGFLVERPDVVRFFRRVRIPDENVVQMVVDASSHRDGAVQDDLHYIVWPGSHPLDLGLADLDALLASPKLFARKVHSTTDGALLDRLDELHARDV